MSGNLIRCQNGHLFSSRRYGTVCPYCNIETATKEKKSVEKSQEEIEDILFLEEENPVCGWIVCVKGPRRGKDYRVMDGKNFVGRADDMDIQILGDNKIARRNHADEEVYEEAEETAEKGPEADTQSQQESGEVSVSDEDIADGMDSDMEI